MASEDRCGRTGTEQSLSPAARDAQNSGPACRAIDVATRLYAATEHELRRRRFDLAVVRATAR